MTRRPVWLPLVAAACALTLFAGLGLWQVERAAERRAEFDAIARAEQAAPVPLPTDAADLEAVAWQPVWVEGRLLRERQFLLDNRTHRGRAGFDVLVPLVLEGDRVVLIDRGWVPADSGGREPAKPVTGNLPETARVEGRLWLPAGGIALGAAVAAGPEWPRMMLRFDYDALEEALDRPLLPAVVRASGDAAWHLERRPVAPPFGPERHIGYAFQWFALAATVLVVTLLLLIRSRRKARNDHEPE